MQEHVEDERIVLEIADLVVSDRRDILRDPPLEVRDRRRRQWLRPPVAESGRWFLRGAVEPEVDKLADGGLARRGRTGEVTLSVQAREKRVAVHNGAFERLERDLDEPTVDSLLYSPAVAMSADVLLIQAASQTMRPSAVLRIGTANDTSLIAFGGQIWPPDDPQ
jgi:hypothetical protein